MDAQHRDDIPADVKNLIAELIREQEWEKHKYIVERLYSINTR